MGLNLHMKGLVTIMLLLCVVMMAVQGSTVRKFSISLTSCRWASKCSLTSSVVVLFRIRMIISVSLTHARYGFYILLGGVPIVAYQDQWPVLVVLPAGVEFGLFQTVVNMVLGSSRMTTPQFETGVPEARVTVVLHSVLADGATFQTFQSHANQLIRRSPVHCSGAAVETGIFCLFNSRYSHLTLLRRWNFLSTFLVLLYC